MQDSGKAREFRFQSGAIFSLAPEFLSYIWPDATVWIAPRSLIRSSHDTSTGEDAAAWPTKLDDAFLVQISA